MHYHPKQCSIKGISLKITIHFALFDPTPKWMFLWSLFCKMFQQPSYLYIIRTKFSHLATGTPKGKAKPSSGIQGWAVQLRGGDVVVKQKYQINKWLLPGTRNIHFKMVGNQLDDSKPLLGNSGVASDAKKQEVSKVSSTHLLNFCGFLTTHLKTRRGN